MPTEYENKVQRLIDVGEEDQKETEILMGVMKRREYYEN